MAKGENNGRVTTRPPTPILSSLLYYCGALALHYVFVPLFAYHRWKYPEFWNPRKPTLTRFYAARPSLEVRIFLPPNHAHENKLPVFFLMHGGGWLIGDAKQDDEQAHLLAHKYGFCVASLNYRSGPHHRFPTPIFDCLALIKEVLADTTLPVDRDRVVAGGFSAGAVTTLALAQLPELKNVIKALVTFYPLTDFTGEGRPEGGTSPWGRKEHLPRLLPLFHAAYIPDGQDLREPLLSATYATREDMPQPLFMITASEDFLWKEAKDLGCRLGGVVEDSALYDSESWESGGVKYQCVKDMPHSFTHFFEKIKVPEWEERRVRANDDIWRDINDWVRRVID
ncbi:Uu.00g022680.m01.CDS01 [Anthostomella pinea]|uniref:Uu.00g022680.m01.CDS01 n=1 Tax=Anthostomella pinea TaxID=933095 RepID=A0AAI8YQW0_9PEZI|nr:Uu.00g022680.m01.CDS01 [Anthostomella pinea]